MTTSMSARSSAASRTSPTPAAPAPARCVTALTLRGEVSGRGVRVDMTGGRLIIDVEYDEGRVENLYLTGPTNIVCKGELTDEELVL